MTKIAALDAGTYYHHETLYGERFSRYFDAILYAREFASAPLDDFDVLFVTCRTDPVLMGPHRQKIADYLQQGGTVVAMGSTGAHLWLPGVVWTDTPTNFWWWREKDGTLGLEVTAPDHGLMRHITLNDAIWHYHGFYHPPDAAEKVIGLREHGGAILYDDRVTTNGRMIVTSLDPCYHHGSFFMPATTRFLDGFLPWLRTLPAAATV